MAHFAEIDRNNIVIRVVVVPDEQEERGQDFLAKDLCLGGTWIQTSYNAKIRKQFAGTGMTYISDADVFVSEKPYPSWSLDSNYDWQPPIDYPDDYNSGKVYSWDEDSQKFIEIVSTEPIA